MSLCQRDLHILEHTSFPSELETGRPVQEFGTVPLCGFETGAGPRDEGPERL